MAPSAGRTDTLDQDLSMISHGQANRTTASHCKAGFLSCLQGCQPTLPGLWAVYDASETNHSCMMCCQTDPTRSSYGPHPCLSYGQFENMMDLSSGNVLSSTLQHVIYPGLSSIFTHLMINNTFWLGQSPIGKLSGVWGCLSKSLDPTATQPRNNIAKRVVSIHTPTTPLCI